MDYEYTTVMSDYDEVREILNNYADVGGWEYVDYIPFNTTSGFFGKINIILKRARE